MTEVVLSDMILLDSKGTGESMSSGQDEFNVPDNLDEVPVAEEPKAEKPKKENNKQSLPSKDGKAEDVATDDIPF